MKKIGIVLIVIAIVMIAPAIVMLYQGIAGAVFKESQVACAGIALMLAVIVGCAGVAMYDTSSDT